MGGCKVCADTSCVVEYTMGGCVSCEFTRWWHGSRCTTWWELWFAYIYSNIHVEKLLVVIDFELERRVVWIERLIIVNIPSVVNRLIINCVRVALWHRERARSSEIDGEVTHLRERLSERSDIPTYTRSRLLYPMRLSRPRVRSDWEQSESIIC